jgi:hypothetical protein
MGAHASRARWKDWLASCALAVLIAVELVTGIIFVAVLVVMLRTI